VEILTKEIAKISINELIRNLISEYFTDKISNASAFIYPLQNVTIRKVKVLKRPKIDGKLLLSG